MARQNGVETCKLQVTVDESTDRLIGEMVRLGVHGVNKADVACSIIRQWLWANQQQLRENGIVIVRAKNKRTS
jgi:hypothetical protein